MTPSKTAFHDCSVDAPDLVTELALRPQINFSSCFWLVSLVLFFVSSISVLFFSLVFLSVCCQQACVLHAGDLMVTDAVSKLSCSRGPMRSQLAVSQ